MPELQRLLDLVSLVKAKEVDVAMERLMVITPLRTVRLGDLPPPLPATPKVSLEIVLSSLISLYSPLLD